MFFRSQPRESTNDTGSGAGIVDGEVQLSSPYTRWDAIKRGCILILAYAGIALSIFTVYSCQFFSYRSLNDEPWDGMMAPFDTLAEASVGLFSYSEQIQSTFKSAVAREACIDYENPFNIGQIEMWTAAQYCAIGAPLAAFLALAHLLSEMCYCRLYCSQVWIPLLFVAASVLQGCTFMIFMDSEFCFNAASENQCSLSAGAWFSLAAIATYVILAVLCTSMDPYAAVRSCCCCFVITKDWRRSRRDHGNGDSDEGHILSETLEKQDPACDDVENGGGATSVSSGEGDTCLKLPDEDDDVGESNMAVDSNFSSVNWKTTDDTVDENLVGQTSTSPSAMNSDPPNGLASLDSAGEVTETVDKDDEDVALNPHEDSTRLVPRRPDLLDICCAGDPLEVGKSLGLPEVKSS